VKSPPDLRDLPLPVVRASDLEQVGDERRWLVDSLWARAGVGIIGGAPKCCKSWLGLDLALSVASGTPCLGAFAVHEKGRALIYLAEDAASVIKARLLGLCRHRALDLAALPIDVITAPVLRLDLARDQQRLDGTVRRLRPTLLLLDPFVRLHRIDENDAGQVSALLAYLRQLQREHGVAIVLVHHARKNGPGTGQSGQGLRGSSDLHAWGDSNLYLRRHHDRLALTVEHRVAAAPDAVAVHLDPGPRDDTTHLEVVPGAGLGPTHSAPRSDGADALDAAVLRRLAQADGALSRTTLRDALRVRNERLGDALIRLLNQHRVVRVGDRFALLQTPVPVPSPSP
jgi:hypothetical protein